MHQVNTHANRNNTCDYRVMDRIGQATVLVLEGVHLSLFGVGEKPPTPYGKQGLPRALSPSNWAAPWVSLPPVWFLPALITGETHRVCGLCNPNT